MYKGVVQDSYNYFPGMDLPDFFIGGRIELIFLGNLFLRLSTFGICELKMSKRLNRRQSPDAV